MITRVLLAYLLIKETGGSSPTWGITERGGDPLIATSPQRVVPFIDGALIPESERAKLALYDANAIKKMNERMAWLSPAHSEGMFFRYHISEGSIWSLFENVYACPWTLDKSPSVSVRHDGGKWTCGLVEIGHTRPEESRCVVYSFGSSTDVTFENRVRELSDCAIHTFDPTCVPTRLDTNPGAAGSTFHSLGLGTRPDPVGTPSFKYPSMDVASIMHALGHASVDILKIDVEGGEFAALNATFHDSKTAPRVGQVLMEVHLPKRGSGANNAHFLWHTLERCGFRQFSIEPVTKMNPGQVEVAFIHKDWTPSGWRK